MKDGRDILSEFGSDSGAGQKAGATNGGKMPVRDVHNYSTPKGPTTFSHEGPGLAGATNHGCCGTQGKH